MTKEHTPEEIKYRLSDLGVQIGNIAIEYIADLEQKNADLKEEIDEIAFARGELEQENESLENIKNIYIGDLLKAKEIIKQLLQWEDRSDYGEHLYQSDPELLEQAEQFLQKE